MDGPISVHYRPLLSTIDHYRPLSSTTVNYRPLSSWTVHFGSYDRPIWLKTAYFRATVHVKDPANENGQGSSLTAIRKVDGPA